MANDRGTKHISYKPAIERWRKWWQSLEPETRTELSNRPHLADCLTLTNSRRKGMWHCTCGVTMRPDEWKKEPTGFWETDNRLDRLREMWSQGKTCAEIANDLGATISTVTGKRNRLGLKSRPSPIIRTPTDAPTKNTERPDKNRRWKRWWWSLTQAMRDDLLTRTHLDTCQTRIAPMRGNPWYCTCGLTMPPGGLKKPATPERKRVEVAASVAAPKPVEVPTPDPRPAMPAVLHNPRTCCWPMWSHGKRPDFRFCGDAPVLGLPYCAAHCDKAYTRTAKWAA
jgi:GcrA cell cycle regulator